MTQAVFDSDKAFLQQPLRAAIIICLTEHRTLHAGVLYRGPNDSESVLHLGWQDLLSRDWKWARLWAVPDVEPERLTSIGGLCRLIWKEYESNRRFPYALRFSQTTFSSSGQLQLGPGAKGLTCATFVLALFNTIGISLVDEDDWPVRPADDRAFLEKIRKITSPAHFAILEQEVESGCKRIRPEEVVGACACPLPAKFAPSRDEAERIQRALGYDP